MVDNSILVCVSSENLHQKVRSFFGSIILNISTYKVKVDEPLTFNIFSYGQSRPNIKIAKLFVCSYPIKAVLHKIR